MCCCRTGIEHAFNVYVQLKISLNFLGYFYGAQMRSLSHDLYLFVKNRCQQYCMSGSCLTVIFFTQHVPRASEFFSKSILTFAKKKKQRKCTRHNFISIIRSFMCIVQDLLVQIRHSCRFVGYYKFLPTFADQSSNAFKEVALVRHPRIGEYALGFITSTVILRRSRDEEELYCVYIPTNHLYLGDIFLVSPNDILRPNLSVREGIGM